MADELLFTPLRIPEHQIHRIRGEDSPAVAVKNAESELRQIAPSNQDGQPVLDLILLGMGDDGHTASLFPGTAALEEKVRKVVANFVPKFNTWRITFTFPLIDQARHVCYLVNANKNVDLLQKVLGGDRQFPSARVEPANGALTWILGEA